MAKLNGAPHGAQPTLTHSESNWLKSQADFDYGEAEGDVDQSQGDRIEFAHKMADFVFSSQKPQSIWANFCAFVYYFAPRFFDDHPGLRQSVEGMGISHVTLHRATLRLEEYFGLPHIERKKRPEARLYQKNAGEEPKVIEKGTPEEEIEECDIALATFRSTP